LDPDPTGLPIFFCLFLASLLLVAAANLHWRCRPRDGRVEEWAPDPLHAAVNRATELGATGLAVILGLASTAALGAGERPWAITGVALVVFFCRDLLPVWLAVPLSEEKRRSIADLGDRCQRPLLVAATAIAALVPHRSHRGREHTVDHAEALEGEDSDETIRELLHNAYDFQDTNVREVMTPRPDIFALDISTPPDELVDRLLQGHYSRVPVIDGDPDRVVGIVYAKDVLAARARGRIPSLRELLQPPLFVPETQKIDALLRDFQTTHVHIAIVVDEHGTTAGLVCMEDILRTLVGEVGEPATTERIVELADGVFQVPAMTDPAAFNQAFGTHIRGDEFETIGGFVVTRLDHFPELGETVQVNDHTLKVARLDGLRIVTLEVRVPTAPSRVQA
jgi:magnesium and cobalt transporter